MRYDDIFNKLGFCDKTEVQRRITDTDKNILILSFCGSGKTEASYFKMLEKGRKTIFIEPMKTLANSIQERLDNYNKQLGLEQVSINHSANNQDKFLQSKYSVTTIDQVLSGYLMLGKQSAIKGKNVIMSNLIFDEVQLFDTDTMLLTTINMLDEIYKLGNRFIIMTATMPQYLIDLLKDRYNMECVITQENRDNRVVRLYYNDELDYNSILSYNKKQIIICNTIKELKQVYENLDKKRVIVLHSNFYNSDRLKIEKQVYKYFGKNSKDNNKILLTTQIVEVGIDISCNRLYTTACSVDNLIQRDGRCCRWGGKGEVIVFKNDDRIYNKEVVENVINHIKDNQGIDFKWDIQKLWVNEILNDYYKERVNATTIKRNKLNFKKCKRSDLIRDIQNFNVIVVNDIDNLTKEDFKRESIGLHIGKLKYIFENNLCYKLEKNKVKQLEYESSIDIGDIIIIQGNNCVYNELGFSIIEDSFIGELCNESPMTEDIKELIYEDYVTETWIHHAIDTRDRIKKQIIKDKFNSEYIHNNINKISFYLGLHDLGKLDVEWSKKYNSEIPLAHFPFTTKRGEYRNHSLISCEVLKDYLKEDKIIYNVIAQHHKKIYKEQENISCTKWELRKGSLKVLREYGLNGDIHIKENEHNINKNDILSATDKEYIDFLYLTGTFMEVEIESINNYIQESKERSCE